MLRRVIGGSMVPTLPPGVLVLACWSPRFAIGDVVVARVKGREVIKRIGSIEANGYFLAGDNTTASTDSRDYGVVAKSAIKGRVVWPKTSMSS